MYARTTLLEFDPVRFDVDAELARFRGLVLPELEEQPGYEGALVLANDEAKGLIVTLWDSREDAEAAVASGFWAEQVGRFVTAFAAPPGRQGYDVVHASLPMLVPD